MRISACREAKRSEAEAQPGGDLSARAKDHAPSRLRTLSVHDRRLGNTRELLPLELAPKAVAGFPGLRFPRQLSELDSNHRRSGASWRGSRSGRPGLTDAAGRS